MRFRLGTNAQEKQKKHLGKVTRMDTDRIDLRGSDPRKSAKSAPIRVTKEMPPKSPIS